MRDKNTVFQQKKILNVGGRLIDLSVPKVMGILNLTPDSFYQPGWKSQGKLPYNKQVLNQVEQMLDEGADFIDIGAYSSRPGAEDISEEEEMSRLLPALKSIVKQFPEVVISVDTFRSEVAKIAVHEGAKLINDISAGELDTNMFKTVAALRVPYILMHMKGNPQNMLQHARYKDVFTEVFEYFQKKIKQLTELGVVDLIIDPGFGFAKTAEHSYTLLAKLEQFRILGIPILVGLSRKSMIYKLLSGTAESALNGTSVANTIALMKGAGILRVHDVKPAVEAIKVISALNSASGNA
jgi:dihydropteroate synthase